jgi:hypothetical protein
MPQQISRTPDYRLRGRTLKREHCPDAVNRVGLPFYPRWNFCAGDKSTFGEQVV